VNSVRKNALSARPTIDSPKARAEMRAFMKVRRRGRGRNFGFPSLARFSMLMSNYLTRKTDCIDRRLLCRLGCGRGRPLGDALPA